MLATKIFGVFFGAFTYFVQRKAYTYHRYTFLAFGLLWVGIELTTAMKWNYSSGRILAQQPLSTRMSLARRWCGVRLSA